jgi:hypothetical protein
MKWLNEHPFVTSIIGIAALLTAIVSIMKAFLEGERTWPGFKKVFGRFVWNVTVFIHGPWTVTRGLHELSVEVKSQGRALASHGCAIADLKREMMNNGGDSMKDIVMLLRADFRSRVSQRSYPYFMFDGASRMVGSSMGLSKLLGGVRTEQLQGLGWRRWLFNEDQSLFIEGMERAIRDRSGFRLVARMVNEQGDRIGAWEWYGDVIVPNPSSPLNFLGVVRPADAQAQQVAESMGFVYPS